MEDRNNLNEFSVKIAKYFYSITNMFYYVVNSYEVRHLGKTYMSLKKYTYSIIYLKKQKR